jgi:hypothetical protein
VLPHDVETGVYRGIYEWQGGDLARHYAARMVALLAPFSNAGTARYQVAEGLRRNEFLLRPEVAPTHEGDWWRLAEPIARGPAPRPAWKPESGTKQPYNGLSGACAWSPSSALWSADEDRPNK